MEGARDVTMGMCGNAKARRARVERTCIFCCFVVGTGSRACGRMKC